MDEATREPAGTEALAGGFAPGTVLLVGAGPGDPGLLTRAGEAALRLADVVLHDALANDALLVLAPGAEKVFVGKRSGAAPVPQEETNALLVAHARAGRRVVRLKGGDPFVFGRGGEEALACAAAGVPCRVIPGVTSAFAAPAAAGIPVTHRGVSKGVLVLHGRSGEEQDWGAAARAAGTIVVLMGVERVEEICARLLEAGRPASEPAALVAQGTLPAQVVVAATLGTLAAAVQEAGSPTPGVLVFGAVGAVARQVRVAGGGAAGEPPT